MLRFRRTPVVIACRLVKCLAGTDAHHIIQMVGASEAYASTGHQPTEHPLRWWWGLVAESLGLACISRGGAGGCGITDGGNDGIRRV